MRLLALLALVAAAAAPAAAQLVTASPGVAFFRVAEPGQPVQTIRVWGGVRVPGTYQVERGLGLIEVLSLAGGPMLDADRATERQRVRIRLARGADADRTVVFEAPLEAILQYDAPLPALQDGDVITVEVDSTARFGLRDALPVVSATASLAVLVLSLLRLGN